MLGSAFGFTGEQTDANNLIYLRARYYNPALGMFQSKDPEMGYMGLAMSMNGYSYVHGNPVNLTDPSGRLVFLLILAAMALGAGIGGSGRAWNRTIVYKWINQNGGEIYNFETRVADALDYGESIKYTVGLIFPEGNDTFVPEYFVMEAYGNMGTHMIEVIPNVPR